MCEELNKTIVTISDFINYKVIFTRLIHPRVLSPIRIVGKGMIVKNVTLKESPLFLPILYKELLPKVQSKQRTMIQSYHQDPRIK